MRSCLILPDEPTQKAESLLVCGADALVIDLRTPESPAWTSALPLMRLARSKEHPAIYVWLGPVESAGIDCALARLKLAPPDGILLDGAKGGSCVQHMGAKLAVLEAEAGLPDNAIAIIAIAKSAEPLLALSSYKHCSPRLRALVFDGESLARSMGVDSPGDGSRRLMLVARSLLTLGAAAAALPALDISAGESRDLSALRTQCFEARSEGFKGRLTRRLEAVASINEVFGTCA